jgi:hypothetical protein
VPARFIAVAAGLAEDVDAPEDDIIADELRDGVDDSAVACEIEEGGRAADALVVLASDVGGDELFRAQPRVVGD